MRPDGVTFNGRHSYDEFGLVLNSKVIPPPEEKTYEVDVVGANGKLDLSTANTDGIVKYYNRPITLNFSLVCPIRQREAAFSKIMNALHCRYMDVIFDIDLAFYWRGKVKITTRQDESIAYGLVSMEVNAEPYKYSVSMSTDDWLWDPFDFHTGIIVYSSYVLSHTV